MVQIIAGEKGKGKTKVLLEKVDESIKTVNGNIVFIDKNTEKMYALNNKVRLINVTDFPITNCDEFIGFICGIVSQDHDLEEMFFDSFLQTSKVKEDEIVHAVKKLEEISKLFNVKFVLSVSMDAATLPSEIKDDIITDL